MATEEYEKENYFADAVLGAIENVRIPMLMYEEEKEVVKKALKMYKDYLEGHTYLRSIKPLNIDMTCPAIKELAERASRDIEIDILEELYQFLWNKLYESEISDGQIMYQIKLYIDGLKEQNIK